MFYKIYAPDTAFIPIQILINHGNTATIYHVGGKPGDRVFPWHDDMKHSNAYTETEIFMPQSNTTVLAALIGLIAFMAVLAILIDFFLRRRRDHRISRMDELEGHDFEFFCADLLRAQGFIEVEVTRGSGDFGVDILAEKDGITYAVQCKRYSGPVGVEAVLRTYGGLAYYERMVGAVMTNQYFTSPAVEAAKKLHILLWDRGYMDAMIEENAPVAVGKK